MILSEHFKRERADRYVFIATTIGVGKVIHSHKQDSCANGVGGYH